MLFVKLSSVLLIRKTNENICLRTSIWFIKDPTYIISEVNAGLILESSHGNLKEPK